MDFGCFIKLLDVKHNPEGLVHMSNISKRVSSVKDAVSPNQSVWVKVLSITGKRLALSMRDVDQENGKDLIPIHIVDSEITYHNGLKGLSGIITKSENEDCIQHSQSRLTESEMWETRQLIAAGVMQQSEVLENYNFNVKFGVLKILVVYNFNIYINFKQFKILKIDYNLFSK